MSRSLRTAWPCSEAGGEYIAGEGAAVPVELAHDDACCGQQFRDAGDRAMDCGGFRGRERNHAADGIVAGGAGNAGQADDGGSPRCG